MIIILDCEHLIHLMLSVLLQWNMTAYKRNSISFVSAVDCITFPWARSVRCVPKKRIWCCDIGQYVTKHHILVISFLQEKGVLCLKLVTALSVLSKTYWLTFARSVLWCTGLYRTQHSPIQESIRFYRKMNVPKLILIEMQWTIMLQQGSGYSKDRCMNCDVDRG